MIAELAATCWRLRECIRVRELAVMHRLEQMCCLRMLEEYKTWKREAGFDRIEIIVQMDAQRLHAGFDLGPLHSKLYYPRWPHTPAEYTLEMIVDAERLRMKLVLSQSAPPPQCDSSPRRSPVVGTGLGEPGVPRAETQSMERKGIFPLQASLDGFTSLDQEMPLIYFKQTSGWTTPKQQLLTRKQLLTRSLRDRRRTGSREG